MPRTRDDCGAKGLEGFVFDMSSTSVKTTILASQLTTYSMDTLHDHPIHNVMALEETSDTLSR